MFVGTYLFFSSASVQTKFAQSLTQRLNNDFDTSISIERAKLSLQGELELSSILIRDHRDDTLFFTQSIATDLDEFDRVFDRVFVFSSLTIDHPLLRITTYAGEQTSNLRQFLDKLNQEKASSSPIVGSADVLNIAGGRVEVLRENEEQVQKFTDLRLQLNNFQVSKESLSSVIAGLSVNSDRLKHPVDLSGELELSNSTLQVNNFNTQSDDAYLTGNFSVNLPPKNGAKGVKNTPFEVQISDGNLPLKLFDQIEPLNQSKKAISVKGRWWGTAMQSKANVQLQLSPSSTVDTDLLLEQDASKQWRIQTESFQSNLIRNDLKELFSLSQNEQQWLDQMSWESLGINAKVDFMPSKSFTGEAQLTLPETTISTTLSLQKTGENWRLQQQFEVLSNQMTLLSTSGLSALEGRGSLEAILNKSQVITHQWAVKLPLLEWKNIPFTNLYFQGSKDNSGEAFSAKIRDSKAQFSLTAYRDRPSPQPFSIRSEIEVINLSALGITPENSDVSVSAEIDINGKQGLFSQIEVNKFDIANRFENKTFSNFAITIEEDQNGKRISQLGADFFDFSVNGKFQFANVGTIIRSSLQEAFLLPKLDNLPTKESFTFDFTIQENILKALYPSISSPEKIQLQGRMSTHSGEAQFSLDLPYFRYKNYTLESLSLVTSSQLKKPVTNFEIKHMYSDELALHELKLITKTKNDLFGGEISGFYGKKKHAFSIGFDFEGSQNQSKIRLDHFQLNTAASQWGINEETSPQLVYNHQTKTLGFEDFNFSTIDQSIAANVSYRSANEFSLDLKSINLDLGDILPVNDKFAFNGRLNTSILFAQGGSNTQAAASVTIDKLFINQVQMGDFELTLSGSPQFNTYQINTKLIHQSKESLVGQGNIYIPSQSLPNLNIDVELHDFNLSFLSKLGKESIKNVTGALSAELNLWGAIRDLKLTGNGSLDNGYLYFPSINTGYEIAKSTAVQFRDNEINFNGAGLIEPKSQTQGQLKGGLRHLNFNSWEMDLVLSSDRLMVYNRENNPEQLFYGKGFLNGRAHFLGPTKSLSLRVEGSSSEGTSLIIPWQENKGLSDTTFIDFFAKDSDQGEEVLEKVSQVDEDFRGFEMVFDLDLNRNAELEIVVDQDSGSTLSGRGAGNILIETNTEGKFNIWGDFIAYEGIYNFRNLGLIDKKFAVKQGGTIVWEGDPTGAQMNLEATYQVPGGANPALLVDNPNFNRKIPTNVEIQLAGNLLKPDDPVFDITFPNTTGIVASEINYRLADQQRRQTQAISLLSQGIFISDVSVSLQGITNNLYEKASDVFSTILGTNEGKLNVGLNYLQGEENPTIDLRTEDRIGLTISTQISDRILFNGKIGVPIDGVDETVIVGDVQIDFILNENGNLRAKVFNRENEFRYLGDELGYTQGVGMSYQVDFNTFQELIQKILSANTKESTNASTSISEAIDYLNKSE